MREQRRGGVGPATSLLEERLQDDDLAISVHVLCELLAGAEGSQNPGLERQRVTSAVESVAVIVPDPARFPQRFARLLHELDRRGERIGAMDLLIATAAVIDEAPLVTADTSHFERVAGLEILSYR